MAANTDGVEAAGGAVEDVEEEGVFAIINERASPAISLRS